MPKTLSRPPKLNGNLEQVPDEPIRQQSTPAVDEKKKTGSPLMKRLEPEMLIKPYSLDFAAGMDSREFAWEKCSRFILRPLDFQSEKDWLAFAKDVWTWTQTATLREKTATVEDLVADLQNDPELLDLLRQKLTELD